MPSDIENKKKLIIINGPTAVGKTAVSVELAERIGGEIISADSMQVYRGMDIGTAKIRPFEMKGIPHHMIDIVDPDEDFNVFIFKERAQKCIDEILERGHIPIIAGGTGFYIQAVLYDVDFCEYSDEEQAVVRERLEKELSDSCALYMHEKLRKIDPESAEAIHPNNTKRLLHALEFYELTGRKMSEHNRDEQEKSSPYDFMYFVLTDDRGAVYDRINKRVDIMIEDGLVAEVDGLKAKYGRDVMSMLGIGYKEIADYLDGTVSIDEAVDNIKKETRHFAKKQLTWFKREKTVEYIDRRDYSSNSAVVTKLVRRIKEHYHL